MSYLENLTARRDYIQSSAFFIARRFMHHTNTDPLTLDFPLCLKREKDASELPKLTDEEREKRYWTVPIVCGFTASDLTIIQYGRMVSILEKGLNIVQQKRWQALEAGLLGASIVVEYGSAIMGHGNYSADEIKEVARQLNNPEIMASFEDIEVIERIAKPVREFRQEEGELTPITRVIRKERPSNPLNSLYDALIIHTSHGSEIPELAKGIDNYIIQKLLPSSE